MARRNSDRVQMEIVGLDSLLKDMGVMEQNYKEAEAVFQRLAAQAIVDQARDNARVVGRQQEKAARTARVFRGNTAQYGGLPWAIGAEFGSIQYRQFPAWRGRGMGAGWFFWPAVEDFKERRMIDLWDQQVWNEIKESFSKGA